MFWTRLTELCDKHAIKATTVVSQLGIAGGCITKWKKGSIPNSDNLQKIANYFNVSIDYLLGKEHKTVKSNLIMLPQNKEYQIPIYETVSAGTGAEPEDNVIGYMTFPFSNENEAQSSIFIKVKGDSMYPTIEDGDLILVHKQDTIDNGYINVVLLDGEALVKKIFYDQHHIELQSINPLYPPIKLQGPDMERIHVIGRVRNVIKNL